MLVNVLVKISYKLRIFVMVMALGDYATNLIRLKAPRYIRVRVHIRVLHSVRYAQ